MKQPKLSDLKIDSRGTKALRLEMAKARKIKITINIDQTSLKRVRKMSDETGIPYQSLINKILKENLHRKDGDDARLDKIEAELEQIKRKLAA